MTQRKYLSDIISETEIEKWQSGDVVLIHAGTGIGKTHFCMNVLADYAKKRNEKVLILQNRKLSKEQLRTKKGNNIDENCKFSNVEIDCYQRYSKFVTKEDFDNQRDLGAFKYKVLDEAHFFVTDCFFNSRTEKSFEHITKNSENSILIFMTATSDIIFDYIKTISTKESFEYGKGVKNYNHICKVEMFKSKDRIVELLKQSLINGTKTLCFVENIKDLIELHEQFKDYSTFYCSEANKIPLNESEIKEITSTEQLVKPILFATSALDTGFSLNDNSIKDIIVSANEIHKVIQLIGRYRSQNNKPQINVHIRNVNMSTFIGQKRELVEWETRLNELTRDYNNTKEFNVKSLCSKFFLDNIEKNHNWLYYDDENSNMKINKFALLYLRTKLERLNKLISGELTFQQELETVFGFKINIFNNEEYQAELENNRIETYLFNALNIPLKGKEVQKKFFSGLNLKKLVGNNNYVIITKAKEINPLIENLGYKIVEMLDGKGLKSFIVKRV